MKQKTKIAAVLLIILLAIGNTRSVRAQTTQDYNYTYDFWEVPRRSLPAFLHTRTIDEDHLGIPVSGIDDVAAGGGRIFLVDTKESRVNVIGSDYELITSIKLIRNEDKKIVTEEETGNQMVLTNPEGVFFHEELNELYIADTGANRIVILDGGGYFLKRVITRPENMLGVTQFNPSKIAVDQTNKIYVVVQSGFEGIVELDGTGKFTRYFGVNKPVVDFWNYFWKSFSSDEQKEKMAKTYAPSFNNVDIDKEGFIYATTVDSAAQTKVFRLNPKGENVLRQEGYLPVQGDLIESAYERNQFVDIAVNEYGVYAVLDQVKGRIFIYNFEGELLNIFGSNGDRKGNFKAPSSIAWYGDSLIAADKTLKCAYVFERTEFGDAVLGSARQYYNGNWEESARLSQEAVRLNANYDLAYINIGKYYLMQDDFKTAMYYFKLGNEKVFYSKAFNGYRNLWVQKNFPWIMGVIVLAAAILISSEVRYHKKRG